MSLSPPVAQPPEATGSDYADCGRLEAQAIVSAFSGHEVLIPGIPDNATAEQIAAQINPISGVGATVSWADVASLENTEYALDHYLIIGVNCTAYAVPTPTVTGRRHWLAGYAVNQDYNCWHANLESDNLEACHNASMGTVIVWSTGATDMTTQEKLDLAHGAIVPLFVERYGWANYAANYADSWAAAYANGTEDLPTIIAQCSKALGLTGETGLQAQVAALQAEVAALKAAPPSNGVTMDQVKAELAQMLKAAQGGV